MKTKFAKFYFIMNLIVMPNFNFAISSNLEDDIDSFIKAPFSKLAINNKVWAVSLVNLMTWKDHKPEKIKHDTHSAVVFEGRGNPTFAKAAREHREKLRAGGLRKLDPADELWFSKKSCQDALDRMIKKSTSGSSTSEDPFDKHFDEFMSVHFSQLPEFNVDENGNWMLLIHLLPDGDSEDTSEAFFGETKGLVRFLNTKSTKARTFDPGYLMNYKKNKIGKYEIIKSWNLLAEDAAIGINEAYINQSKITYTRSGGTTSTTIDQRLHCTSFAEALLRCCGFFDAAGYVLANRKLFNFGNVIVSVTIPKSLRLNSDAYLYKPSDRNAWKKLLPQIKNNQLILDPTVDGLDKVDQVNIKQVTTDTTNKCTLF